MKKILKYLFISFISIILLIGIIIGGINYYVLSFSNDHYYYNIDWLDEKFIWLVFWASVIWNKTPSEILKDRLKVAQKAYEEWKIKKIIVSWDNSTITYNEPQVMKNYLISIWVKADDIYMDHAWFDTYSSLYRARDIFWAEELILFTQNFHLKRAMYLASRLWIEVYWVETNLQRYYRENYYDMREFFARIKAFLNVDIFNRKPKYLWERVYIIDDLEIEKVKNLILEDKND